MKIQANLKAATPKPVPAAWYRAAISGKKYKNYSKPDKANDQYPMYEFTILSESPIGDPNEPSTIGRKVFQGIFVDWKMAQLYQAALSLSPEEMPESEYDDDEIVGHELMIEVVHDTYTPADGKPEIRTHVENFKSL